MPETEPAAAARRARLTLEAELAALSELRDLLPDAALDRLERYVALLLTANRRLNLTRVTEPDAVARLHLLDALVALPRIRELAPATAVDLGSGGGIPGIPLALALPRTRWILVDSVGKKAAALRDFAAELALANVEVVAERAETLARDPSFRERAQLVTARACAPLPVLAELAMPLLALGGSLVAWKGPLSERDGEVRAGRTALGEVGGRLFAIRPAPAAALGGHTLVEAEKVRPTPARFPRRPGEPARRPLG